MIMCNNKYIVMTSYYNVPGFSNN